MSGDDHASDLRDALAAPALQRGQARADGLAQLIASCPRLGGVGRAFLAIPSCAVADSLVVLAAAVLDFEEPCPTGLVLADLVAGFFADFVFLVMAVSALLDR